MTTGKSMQRYFRLHCRVYLAALALLVVTKLFLVDGWWPIGVGAVWGFALLVHYLVVKSASIDDDWADRRADAVTDKAYDAGHMSDIRDRHADAKSNPDDDSPNDRRTS